MARRRRKNGSHPILGSLLGWLVGSGVGGAIGQLVTGASAGTVTKNADGTPTAEPSTLARTAPYATIGGLGGGIAGYFIGR